MTDRETVRDLIAAAVSNTYHDRTGDRDPVEPADFYGGPGIVFTAEDGDRFILLVQREERKRAREEGSTGD